jgi:hypothetical protein
MGQAHTYVFFWVRHGDVPTVNRMRVDMVGSPDISEPPAGLLKSFDKFGAIHSAIMLIA